MHEEYREDEPFESLMHAWTGLSTSRGFLPTSRAFTCLARTKPSGVDHGRRPVADSLLTFLNICRSMAMISVLAAWPELTVVGLPRHYLL